MPEISSSASSPFRSTRSGGRGRGNRAGLRTTDPYAKTQTSRRPGSLSQTQASKLPVLRGLPQQQHQVRMETATLNANSNKSVTHMITPSPSVHKGASKADHDLQSRTENAPPALAPQLGDNTAAVSFSSSTAMSTQFESKDSPARLPPPMDNYLHKAFDDLRSIADDLKLVKNWKW